MFACGREISQRVGLWAAALATFSPAMYYYSQEARAYALLVLFSAIAFLCWQRALRIGDGRSLAWWAGTSALALLTHYFAVFLFVPEALILLRRMGLRRVWAPIGAVCAVGLALVPLAISQRSDARPSGSKNPRSLNRIAETVKQFLVGLYGPVEIATAVVAGCSGWPSRGRAVAHRPSRARRGAGCGDRRGRRAGIAAAARRRPRDRRLRRTQRDRGLDPLRDRARRGASGRARAGRIGPALGGAMCAVGIGVIVATNLLPGYQRDDWRAIADAVRRFAR